MTVKESLIELLLKNRDTYISGEEIAGSLDCTRAAVWKAVNALKTDGYVIDAVKNRGYRISDNSDVLSESEIEKYLASDEDHGKQESCSGTSSAHKVYVYQEITSTNDVLKTMAQTDHAPSGTVIVSDYQTGGKGRLGRTFYSPKGSGLYLSMLLRPEGSVNENLIITAQAAVAVYRAIKKVTGIELGIKWVNDLYLGSKKVTGILSEGQASMESGRLEYVIVGIGINLYDPEGGFPEDIKLKAGSILGSKESGITENGRHFDRNMIAAEVIKEFYKLSEAETLAPEYIEKNIVPGHEIVVINGSKSRSAKALRILEDGCLEIEEEDHSITKLVYGEVSVRLQSGLA